MSMAKIVKIPTDKSPVLQLYLSYSQDIARASALRATIPRTETWSLCTFYRTLFRKDIIPHAKWPFTFLIGQQNTSTQRNPLPDHLKCAYMVYSNKRMKIKSIFDRLIFLTFLTILPKSRPLFPIHTDGYSKRMCEWLPDSRSSLSKGR